MNSKGRIQKIISALLAMMLLFVFAGCGSSEGDTMGEEPGTVIAETEDEITIVDQAGREVTVKRDIESIALSYRVAIRFLLSLDQGDKIKGIGKSEPFLETLQPSLADCVNVGQGVADIEAVAELNPDVFFHKATDRETLDALEKIGIPAIGIQIETPEEMTTALDIMGKVCGEEEKAETLIDYYKNRLEEIDQRTAGIQEQDKKTAVVMGTSIGKVADGFMLQGEMLERAGAINVAKDLEATELWPTAGAEQIFKWNPDYIFITGSESALYSADDILEDKNWSELTAVKNGDVYVMPAKVDSWEFPGVVSILGIDYMMHVMYPELMSEEELTQEVDSFYELSYGVTLDRSELGY
ncbi:MAG: ABC transporter substrate-binding protein [Clostridiales bacterium]|nr:ABC transporter substrate-binding protein [Clostridiales bacterium]